MPEPETEKLVIRDNRKIDPVTGEARTKGGVAAPAAEPAAEPAAGPTVDAALLDERTRDLQRVQAEYANYRKRADRERQAAGDLAVGRTLVELLPVVDDLDRARAHGDLIGALKAVADKIEGVFAKLGAVAFGQVGDPFDPAIHEAVLHDESDAVTVPTCTTVLRQGYRHGERLLRAAMVGVTDPITPAPTAAEPQMTDPSTENEEPTQDAHGEPPAGVGAGGPHGDELQAAVEDATQPHEEQSAAE